MHTSRRGLLSGMAGIAGYAMAIRSPLSAPPIVRGEITPQEFGATGGDATKDTLAWNRAIAEASRAGRPVIGSGTYILRVPARSDWNWWGRPSASTHVAVQLRSHTHVFGKDCRILVGRPEAPPSNREPKHILFGTDGNIGPGKLTDIQFEGVTFDFRDEFGPVHPATYAIGIVGVDDFQRRNVTIMSSGALAGRGLLSENTRGRKDSDIRHLNIVQGIYTRYEAGVVMRRITFDKFNEALDFDGPCWDVTLEDLQFRNGFREAQCIDTAGGDRWTISNVRAENTGPILMIYTKAIAWPTYRQFLDHADKQKATNIVAPSNWIVRNVWGRNVGRTQKKKGDLLGESLRVGSYRNDHWFKVTGGTPSPRNITIENWTLDDSAPINVGDCENLVMRHVVITNPKTDDDGETGAALVLREPKAANGGKITGIVSDVAVKNSRGMGVNAVAGRQLALENITVDGYNLGRNGATNAGIRLRPRPGTVEKPSLGRATVTRGTGKDIDDAPSR